MKILYLAWDDKAWRGTLIDALRKKGHIVLVISSTSSFLCFSRLRAIIKILLSRFDVILGDYISDVGYYAVRAGKLLKKPVVIYARGGDVDTLDPNFSRNINLSKVKYAVKYADVVMCASSYLCNRIPEIEGNIEHKTKLVYNGVDTSKFHPKIDKDFNYRILLVGNLLKLDNDRFIKGLDVAVKALSDVMKKFPTASLTIVGPDPKGLRQDLEELFQENKVELNATYIGPLYGAEYVRAFQSHDLFILPSYIERFGVVLIEAMSAGLPVVATRTGGIPEIVPNDYLVVVGDFKALSSKICDIFNLTDVQRMALGMKNKCLVEDRFSEEQQVDGVISCLKEAIAKHR